MEIRKILLCVDGQEQTDKAEDFAIGLAKSAPAMICAVYVVDPKLMKFADEVYAVGRDEYRHYIDKTLRSEGSAALDSFLRKAFNEQIQAVSKMRCGSPEAEILSEIEEGDYDLVVMGSRFLTDWRSRLGSHNLPEKVFKKAKKPVVFVR
jgi:nucleotide-binding universal stress UspA family protein